MKDPVIQELWEIKDRIAREHGNDVDQLARMLREKEKSKRSAATVKTRKADTKNKSDL